ncbi:MAG: M20 family metallopeptidase [Planctomycetes bacterium]|nr:M20 family metallopeptidase [Planctomycetota bacterium]
MNSGSKRCLIRGMRWSAVILTAFALLNGCVAKQEIATPKEPKELVSEENLVRLVQQMVRIDTEFSKGIVHNHKDMAEFLGKELKAIGVEVEVVYPEEPFEAPYHRGLNVKYPGDPADFPVVVARLRGSTGKPVLGLETHYNSVVIGDRELWTEDPLGGEIIDRKIYGRGSTNSHSGVAQRIETLRVLKESGIRMEGDLVVTLIPGEGATEFGLPWVVEHRPELIAADWYLAGSIGPRFTKSGGHIWAKLTVVGKMHHPPGGINAAHQIVEIIPAVIDVDRWMTWKDDPVFSGKKPAVDVTVLSTGDPRNVAVNVMPAKAEALLDIRLFPNQEPPQVVTELNQLLDKLMKENPALHVELEVTHCQKVPEQLSDFITEDDPLVQEILAFSREYTGRQDIKMEWVGGVGGGRPDLWNAGAIVVFAGGLKLPGGGGGAHSPDEFLRIDGLAPSTQIMVDFVQRVLGNGTRPGIRPPNKRPARVSLD